MPEEQVGTPAWWLERLNKRLDARRKYVELYEAYYQGQHRLAFATSKFRETFGSLFSAFADNWCGLVVDASVERMQVDGFRFGDAEQGDRDAWALWQANLLDAESSLGFLEAVKHGESFLLVAPGEPPQITVEHPAQVIVDYAPGNRRLRRAALKKWLDDSGFLMATLYLPTGVLKFRSARKATRATSKVTWVERDEPERNPFGVVPMVPLRNNPALLTGGRSDLDPVIPLQDAVNKLVADMIVASEYAAFRQRWATGVEIPNDPTTGKPMTEQFLSSISRMWTVQADDAAFGEFEASDLGNYVKAIEMLIQHVAAQTRTPPHYLLGQSGAFPSGESLKATETGLVAKVREKQLLFGEALEEAMRLAFGLMGDIGKAKAMDAQTLWRDPESRTEAELTDAVIKQYQAGLITWRTALTRLRYSQTEIDRMAKERTQERLETVDLNALVA